ncbi:MAG TPA: hypothetical protein VHH88_04225 [Verrucomicrobiae bacterium]|nr:hypothetical protein [Verrucomicrobiae bacterium]
MGRKAGFLFAFLLPFAASAAPAPAPEQLLPDDTLFVATVPDVTKAKTELLRSAPARFWQDPAMKAFRDDFYAKWQEQILKPLDQAMGLHPEDFLPLFRGQITFAVFRDGWNSESKSGPAWLLVADAGDKKDKLKETVDRVRGKWSELGRKIRTLRIRGIDFSILTLATNDLPDGVKQFFPQSAEVQELGADGHVKSVKPSGNEIFVGQADSLLLVGSSARSIEKVLNRLDGGGVPALAEVAAFHACQLSLFRDAPAYAWVNAKTLLDVLGGTQAAKASDSADPLPAPQPNKILTALGFSGVKSLALTLQGSDEGAVARFFIGVPDSGRQGLFKVFSGPERDCLPPPFVPADVIEFHRWRIDGRQSWAALEKMLDDISPQALGGLNFVIDTANARAKESDPGFDLKKTLLGNIGDDFIEYVRPSRASAAGDAQAGRTLLLVGSPNPQQLTAALKALFVIFPGSDSATEREFLGHKVYSLPSPSLPLPLGMPSPAPGKILSYAASGGYVAFSTDASLLEEFLRGPDTQSKALRDVPGLTDAMKRAGGAGTYMSSYKNQAFKLRAEFDAARNDPASLTNGSLPGANPLTDSLPITGPEKDIKGLMNFSLLPPFDKVSKYFSFTVSSVGADVDGITWKLFAPASSALNETAKK